ncbi:Na(+)/citrate cotransporter-like [Clavelina lepadiformis]|uniref:Na(+)/citrate cotransporter-like n=1 Tax=Clavelina lepadiformis TaxID=159417 RepID=UPI004041EB17
MDEERKIFCIPSISTLVIVITPLLLLPLPVYIPGKESLIVYISLLVSVYWASACLPLSVTGIIPVFLFPAAGILTNKEATSAFFFPGLWLFTGSIIFAIAVQSSNLHFRIALKMLLLIGTRPKRLLLGFMVTAFILSMFLANLAVVAMLMPIAEEVLNEMEKPTASEERLNLELNESKLLKINLTDKEDASPLMEDGNNQSEHAQNHANRMKRFRVALTLSVSYSSAVGGIGTIPGSAGNVAVVAMLKDLYPDSPEISYGQWFLYCTPCAAVTLILMYAWILWYHLGFSSKEEMDENFSARKMMMKKYDELGPITWDQLWILILFLTTVVFWFTRSPGFCTGWGDGVMDGYVADGTVVMATSFLLFLIPNQKPVVFDRPDKAKRRSVPLLTWKVFEAKFPWGILFVVGGCLTIAKAFESSNLPDILEEALSFLAWIPPWLTCLVAALFTTYVTECMSGIAALTLIFPVMKGVAKTTHIHPFYFSMPPAQACSLAFMLPVATVPTTLAYSYGHFTIKDMIKTGWLLNLVGVFVIMLGTHTYGGFIFNFDQYPLWAETLNASQAGEIYNLTLNNTL